MAQGFGLGKEVIQGVGLTLVMITVFVVIGSQIAVKTSHGPEHGHSEKAEAHADTVDQPVDDAKKEAPKDAPK